MDKAPVPVDECVVEKFAEQHTMEVPRRNNGRDAVGPEEEGELVGYLQLRQEGLGGRLVREEVAGGERRPT